MIQAITLFLLGVFTAITLTSGCGKHDPNAVRGPLGSGSVVDVEEYGEEGTVIETPTVTMENNVTIYNYTVQLKSGRVVKVKRPKHRDSGSNDHNS